LSAQGAVPLDTTRERGWRRFLPALLLFLVIPVAPYLPLFVPVQETILLLATTMAACTIVGWWLGGRIFLPIAWTALAIWMLWRPISGNASYDAMARSWALILAATFGIVSIVGAGQRFFARALTASVLTLCIVGAVLMTKPQASASFSRVFSEELHRRSDSAQVNWAKGRSAPEWQKLEQESETWRQMSEEVTRIYTTAPDVTAVVVPGLLVLESMAALALVWGLYHRVSRVRLGPPLGALREFRFNDQLVWGLVAGITFVALPTLGSFRGAGFNLLLFFGVLYALRGLGVLTWFLAPRRIALALLVVLAVVSWPIIGIFSLGLGLGDTWLDWRGRARPTS